MADPIIDFLNARLAEEERGAKAITGYTYQFEEGGNSHPMRLPAPERVLADVAAKRKIAELHTPKFPPGDDGPNCPSCILTYWLPSWEPYPCPTLRALVQPYRWHPEFREEWADE